MSAGCQIWLERLQPLFFTLAIGSLAWQIWLVRTRPPTRRKSSVKVVLAVSVLLNVVVVGGWLAILVRYR